MKIAIVGSAVTSCHLAPYDDPSWEIWTLNDMYKVAKKIDRLFQLHDPDKVQVADPEEWEWLKTTTTPIWMHRPVDSIPFAQQYPTEVITKQYRRYFTNSISWMIALAIHEGADEIGIWGVDMAHGTEYAAQRPSCEYMIGRAEGAGIKVYISEKSDLLKCRNLYGLDDDDFTANIDNRLVGLNAQLLELRNQKTQAMLNEAKTEGAIEMAAYLKTAWK